jgi:release factor glutamine methyltransferase
VAAANVRRLGAGARLRLVAGDLAAPFDLAAFDLVVSNPPYVDPAEAAALPAEVCNFEPHLALFSPGRGDYTLARLLAGCGGLRRGAFVVVEIGFGQLDRARRHAEAAGFELLEARRDYAEIPRVLSLRRR